MRVTHFGYGDGVRVMHFVPYFPPGRVGGVGEFVAALHHGLLARGHASQVVTTGTPEADPVHRIARTRLGWFVSMLSWTREAARSDIVHCQSGEALPIMLALRLVPRRRARLVVTFHVSSLGIQRAETGFHLGRRRIGPGLGQQISGGSMGILHRVIDAAALRLADGVSCVAASTARELLGHGHRANACVIYNPLRPAPKVVNECEPVDLFYAGLASHRKRTALLPFVLARVRSTRPDARLRIAGFDLDDVPDLGELFRQQGCFDAVECVGRLQPDELTAHYRAARVVVLPSAYEGLPYVLIEALAQGTPVVATRVSGHPEVIENGVGGLLVPVDDPDAMARACTDLLADPARARELGQAGQRAVAEKFDPERQIDAYVAYYRALAKETS